MSKTVRDLGEFGLIEALRDALPAQTVRGRSLLVGIGDDCAIWRPTPDEALVITTDALIEGIHFRLDWTDWLSLGHKVLAVNLSDLASMGASPRFVTLTLGLRGTELVEDLRDLYRGLGALAAQHGVMIAGGDIVSSPHGMTIDVTAIGETREGYALTRTGAERGDVIAVSGTLGASAAGLRLLRDGGAARNAATADLLIDAHLRPQPRVALGAALLREGASAAMDVSDGLFGDLPKLLAASGVAGIVYASRVPVAAAVQGLFPVDWFDLATRGGEDYELLFTCPAELFDDIAAAANDVGSTVSAIGEVVALGAYAPLRLRLPDGSMSAVLTGAFDHFA